MSGLCKYKDLAGKPGEGVHAWRLGGTRGTREGVAGVDLLVTAGAAFLISRAMLNNSPPLASFLIVFIILLLVGVASHAAFCVDTTINRALNLSVAKKQ